MLKSIQKTWRPNFCAITTTRRLLHLESFDRSTIALSDLVPDDPAHTVKFRNLFLRDACPSRVNPSTHQKDFSTGQLDPEVHATDVKVDNEKKILKVEWSDGQKSVYPHKLLERYSTPRARRKYRMLDQSNFTIWNNQKVDKVFSVPYNDYMNSKFAFSETLKQLHRDGLVFITGIDRPEKSSGLIPVEQIAEKVGYIKQTFYGQSWNVESVPDAKNVAYTSVYLPLHMDLLYYESPPGIQLLHVIDNSTVGGESVFADSFAAARHVQETDIEAYKALTKVPLTFHYEHDTDHYYYQRPLVVENRYAPPDENGRYPLEHVNYSPPFQGPLDIMTTKEDISGKEVAAFMRGLKLFEAYIDDPSNQLELHTPEGTCMVFMNRRILHGRREFQGTSGRRFFKGTYLDIDTFHSKLRTTCRKVPKGK